MSYHEAVEEFKLDGKTISIVHDDAPESPRECCCLGRMVCFHSRHTLVNETDLRSDDFPSWGGVESHLWEVEKATHVLPIFMMDHGGLSLSTKPFGCRWDSGQVGFIYTTKALREEIGVPDDHVGEALMNEVETYSKWQSGEVYGFQVIAHKTCATCAHVEDEVVASCYGFYSVEDAKAEAIAEAEAVA